MTCATTMFCILLAAAAAFGQNDRGAIAGTVTDPVEAVVPSAKIVARNVETGAVFETGAPETGNFTGTVPVLIG